MTQAVGGSVADRNPNAGTVQLARTERRLRSPRGHHGSAENPGGWTVSDISSGIRSQLAGLAGGLNRWRLARWAALLPKIAALEPELQTARRRATPQAEPLAALPRQERRAACAAAGRRLRPGPRGRPADDRHAALRRAVARRHRHVPPLDRRDADRRRQDADGHAAAVPARPAGQGLPPGHGQRLSGPPRRRVDAADLRGPGHERRRDRDPDVAAAAAQGLRLRRHLRHGQGVRLRFPPRPAAVAAHRRGADRPAGRHVGQGAARPPTKSRSRASPTSPWSTRPTAS